MSLRIVQSSGKTDFVSVDMPWAAWDGTEVKTDLSVGVFVAIEVPLCSLADAAASKVAAVGQGVSLDVSTTRAICQRQSNKRDLRFGVVDIDRYMKGEPT